MMVTVKALRAHDNEYGAQRPKAEGDSYQCPATVAATLAAAGLVEVAAPAKGKAKR